jgi:hypothetical protein
MHYFFESAKIDPSLIQPHDRGSYRDLMAEQPGEG